MTSNHETRKVLSIGLDLKEKVAGLLAEEQSSTRRGGKLGNGEESNLHALEHANDGHEEEEEEDGESRSDAGVLDGDGGLAFKEGLEGGGQAESEDGEGSDDAAPEEGEGEAGLGWLVADDGLAERTFWMR